MRQGFVMALALVSGVLLSTEAAAQAPFTGAYAGAEAGVIDHHFWLSEAAGGVTVSDRYYRDKDLGGGVFAGYDHAIGRRLRIGGEVALTTGGGDPAATFSDGSTFQATPRYGYRLTARAGVVAAPWLMLYANGGYGGNRYRLRGTARVADAHEWGSSFLVGAGLEVRASDRIGIRFDFKHVDNQSNQWLLGVPIRF
jgi:outer membrane immunogenic protein